MSRESLLRVIDRLHERETLGMDGQRGRISRKFEEMSFVLGDYENNNFENKRKEADRIAGLLDRILEAASIVDMDDDTGRSSTSSSLASELRARASDLRGGRDATFRRRVDALLLSTDGEEGNDQDGSVVGGGDCVIEEYARRSIDGGGEGDHRESVEGDKGKERRTRRRKEAERKMNRFVEMPPWLPSYLATYAAASIIDVPASHWRTLRTELMVDAGFVCTSWDTNDAAAVFRGRWEYSRSGADGVGGSGRRIVLGGTNANDVEGRTIGAAFSKLQERVGNHAHLRDSIRLFLVDDNEWQSSYESFSVGGSVGNQKLRRDDREGMTPLSVVIALPRDVTPERECSSAIRSLAVVSTLLTAFTTLTYAIGAYALNPTFFHAIVKENDVSAVPMCLPIFVGVLAVSAFHELGHLLAARRHGVKLGRPTPLPSLQVGTFGSITSLRSFPSTRSVLFDVAAAGPGASMLVSILLIVSGLNLTITAQSLTSLPVVPAAVMKSSFLIGQIVTIVAPAMILAPLSQPVPIHPLFLVGLAGIVMSAVNMLPIGRLDGGRACAAIFGRRVASLISFMSLIILAYYSLIGGSGIAAFWGSLLILTQQRLADVPCVNEVTGVGNLRTYMYVGGSFLALLTLLPFLGGIGPM
ncbi:hypothetical protein ACHAXA_008995 [Cyclostephanos tholiformis]|uniref:Peptidase M50 domain-containing protein n=1 Tax=Cyclostephanos tholiformis TaxID=382380 RepID=A0ABD3RHT0_9STRA